jgi:hypothetical protein
VLRELERVKKAGEENNLIMSIVISNINSKNCLKFHEGRGL